MNSHLLPFPYNQTEARHIPGIKCLAKALYRVSRTLSLPQTLVPAGRTPVRVVCVSDTHNATPDIPDGDLLIHAGDLTARGTYEELKPQVEWLSRLPHAHKVIIAGNHDCLLDTSFIDRSGRLSGSPRGPSSVEWGDIHYLQESSVTIDFTQGRKLKIFGSPFTPENGDWAFKYPAIRDYWSREIPDDADIVIIHGPPALHLASGKGGDGYLLRELRRCRPAIIVHGHAHDGYGESLLLHDGIQEPLDDILLQAGAISALLRALLFIPVATFRRLLFLPTESTRLVNAAHAPGPKLTKPKPPIVVDL